ncbi:MAG TPA: lipocalin family protein [Kofleriaceae bacterium]
MRLLLIALLVVAAPAFVYAGPTPFVGKWKLDAVRTKDGPVPKEKLAGGGMTWDFKSDGKLVMTVWKGKDAVTANGTWTLDGTTISVDENGKVNKMTYKKIGKKLELAGAAPSTVVMTFIKTK